MDKRFLTLIFPFVLVSCSQVSDTDNSESNVQSETIQTVENTSGHAVNDAESIRLDDLPKIVVDEISGYDSPEDKGWSPKVSKVVSGKTELFIIDYSESQGYCGSAGCGLIIFAGSGGQFEKIWEDNVLGYKVGNPKDGSILLDFIMRSWSCKNGGDGFECTVKFKFDGSRMINTDGNLQTS